ncbi:T9SS type A sorting domain-containing protein [Hymenobacter perfusus]|uniref:T9SS C-terminal target domain-containing protein n=1 Tax=Hymenobacter perfusus TaxID=1236770 RepID=A0A3R9UYH9_9BACT|nr:T9SS type A sorting domain-containing protein [Hymenobacter perfusus]RSK42854.1 T9SS C-terminal target domain-containing protein [Hymenobacter perfusus]
MKHTYSRAAHAAYAHSMVLAGHLFLLVALLLPWGARAQTWSAAGIGSSSQTNGTSITQATAVDADGNVFVTGSFTGQVGFGSTVLSSSVGGEDLFVAKYVPATATWAWAQSGGGTSFDQGLGIAVSGGNVYVTGFITNNTANASDVRFGGTDPTTSTVVQHGASSTNSQDLVVAKYTDNGPSATLGWTQVGGGTSDFDQGNGIAVSGSSVYVTGAIVNNTANTNMVLFGGTGTTAGTVQQNGASTSSTLDLVVAKYTDNGATTTLGWTQVGGGISSDQGNGIAVSGTSVYVTGYIINSTTNANTVRFGGTGTTAGTVQQNGASTSSTLDLVVAKYTDNGTTATLRWTQVGGGTNDDRGQGIAVSGTSVYVTGFIRNTTTNTNMVRFGGTGTTAGTVQQNGASTGNASDLVVVKYTDNGATATLRWTQVGGGTNGDQGLGIAVSGSSVYVTGYILNNIANASTVRFGGTGTTAGTVQQNGASTSNSVDLVVAKYTDNGATATLRWTQVGGGTTFDQGQGIAVSGSSVYVAGYVGATSVANFGAATGTPLLGTASRRAVLATLTDNASAGPWQTLAATANGGTSQTRATAVDADGNVFVTGSFTGQVAFGSTVLSSVGSEDLFVAKYVPATATWAWAQSGGGTGNDLGLGVAVSGTSVYVTGYIINSTVNTSGVLFGGTGTTAGTVVQHGASGSDSQDLVVVKYTDNGTSATLGWTQVGGGTSNDQGLGIAVSGGNVYVTGYITNTTTNTNLVRFGGTGTTAGTVVQHGASSTNSQDLVVAEYTDNGTTATLGWTQVGGGTSNDQGLGIAVSGSSVYVTGYITNTTTNTNLVRFGGTGTTAGTVVQHGASSTNSQDLVVAEYTDNGTTATLGWTQVGGGTGTDLGLGIAVSGSSVYVTGYIRNTTGNTSGVLFGGTGTTAGTVQVNGATATSSSDLVVVKYTDNGTTATLGWTQVGGGTGTDLGLGIAVSGTRVYVTGYIRPSATFGSFTIANPDGDANFLGELLDAAPLPVELTQFTAAPEGTQAVRLAWATASEVNSAAFEVERSPDGHTFGAVGTVAAAGRSTASRRYTLLDAALPTGAVVLYYRLRQVDADGTFSYSPVRVVTRTSVATLQLYPNPTTGAAMLTGAAPSTAITVLDALGRPVLRATADATGTARLGLPAGQPAGMYLVRSGAQTVRLLRR